MKAPLKVTKLWGSELWLHNNTDYCMKILVLNPGFQSSFHFHRIKRETFLVVQGRVKLEVMPYYMKMPDVGDAYIQVKELGYLEYFTLDPRVPHRFTAIDGPAVIVEASTEHLDSDVVRLEESRAI